MNKVILIGRLAKDPEARATTTGKNLANFPLAVSEGKDKAQFFNCVAWNKTADLICNYCQKGSQVMVSGKIQNRSWDKPDGTKGYATDIVASEIEFLSSKSKSSDQEIDVDDIMDELKAPF